MPQRASSDGGVRSAPNWTGAAGDAIVRAHGFPDASEMAAYTKIYTWLRGEEVGADSFGNHYFRSKRWRRDDGRRERRWVVYGGEPEASTVPPEWHAWLHYIAAEPPKPGTAKVQAWEKDHLPNLTGTAAAYRPPGHEFKGGQRARATGDYEPWTPN